MKKSRKNHLTNVTLLLATFIICLMAVDLITLILFPTSRIYEYNEATDYLLKANQKAEFNTREFSTIIEINNLGLRDDPIKKETKKILILGDSFTFGHGVNQSQAYPQLLEKLIQSTNPNWEVINAGINGYDTKRELNYLKERGIHFNPEIIIVAFVINDPLSNHGDYWFSPIPVDATRHIPLKSVAAAIEYAKNPERLLWKLGKNPEYALQHKICYDTNQCQEAWATTIDYLKRAQELAEENKAIFRVLNIPLQEQINAVQDEATYQLSSLPLIDLKNAPLEAGDYYETDGHLSPQGHTKAATYLQEQLMHLLNQ